MNLPITLIESPRARRSDPSTSHDAAARVSEFAHSQHQAILSALRQLGRAGAEQLAAELKLNAYQVRKRTKELQDAGLCRTTGETRKTVTGRFERVWEAV